MKENFLFVYFFTLFSVIFHTYCYASKTTSTVMDLDQTEVLVEANFANGNLTGENFVYFKNGELKTYLNLKQTSEDANILSGIINSYDKSGFLVNSYKIKQNKLNQINEDSETIKSVNSDSLLALLLYPLRYNSTDHDVNVTVYPKLKYATFDPIPKFSCSPVNGDIILSVEVFYDGFVGEIKVIKTLAQPINEIAVQSVRKWIFIPATYLEKNVSCKIFISIQFNYSDWELKLK